MSQIFYLLVKHSNHISCLVKICQMAFKPVIWHSISFKPIDVDYDMLILKL